MKLHDFVDLGSSPKMACFCEKEIIVSKEQSCSIPGLAPQLYIVGVSTPRLPGRNPYMLYAMGVSTSIL